MSPGRQWPDDVTAQLGHCTLDFSCFFFIWHHNFQMIWIMFSVDIAFRMLSFSVKSSPKYYLVCLQISWNRIFFCLLLALPYLYSVHPSVSSSFLLGWHHENVQGCFLWVRSMWSPGKRWGKSQAKERILAFYSSWLYPSAKGQFYRALTFWEIATSPHILLD